MCHVVLTQLGIGLVLLVQVFHIPLKLHVPGCEILLELLDE